MVSIITVHHHQLSIITSGAATRSFFSFRASAQYRVPADGGDGKGRKLRALKAAGKRGERAG
jgi:hypothetical protein